MKSLAKITILVWIASLMGCSFQFVARDADTYRQDTRDLLSTKNGDIRACYDAQLKKDKKVSGVVVVKFMVQEETGAIVNPEVDAAESTAPDTLSQCILNAIDGLVLDPPDQRQGIATFSWEFKPSA